MLLVASACASRPQAPRDVSSELPPWMTRGEEVRLEVAAKLLDTGNTYQALEIVRAMRQEGFNTPELDLLQGRAMRLDGLWDESEHLLLAAEKGMHRDPRPQAELCVLFADSGRVPQAIEACREVVKRDEKAANGWNNLGFLLLATDVNDEALKALTTAVELDGTNERYRNNLGMAQATLGRDEAAFRTFQSTLPRSLAAFNVGVALERADDKPGALAYYERALSIDPQLTEAVAARDRLRNPAAGQPSAETTPFQ
jgi:tetratricopeptide (TPR) repeat protein